jgi:hypothetical protein
MSAELGLQHFFKQNEVQMSQGSGWEWSGGLSFLFCFVLLQYSGLNSGPTP